MNNDTATRVTKVREIMKSKHIDAVIIPGTDPHQSEYCAPHWKVRDWVSGFTGSAGTVVITSNKAALWTDSRYFLQSGIQLKGSGIELMKDGIEGTPTINQWLCDELSQGAVVGVDGLLFSLSETDTMKMDFAAKNIELNTAFAPCNQLWDNRPELPDTPIFIHDVKYAGTPAKEKLNSVMKTVVANGADSLLITALDEIAWVLNLRGADVPCNPVFMSYLYVSKTAKYLFVNTNKINKDVAEYLSANGIVAKEYNEILGFLSSLPKTDRVYVDSAKVSISILNNISAQCVKGSSVVVLPKSLKNDVQIAGTRNAMERDGAALVRFFRWLEKAIHTETITECTIGEKLVEYRSKGDLFVGESFSTIAGYKSNGAIVHYFPEKETCSTLKADGMLLIDSGAQYFDGTTDITRTLSLGNPTADERKNFTLVMKGHIALGTAIFPAGTRGAQLDALARQFLWQNGLNYLHGTGHGVGHFLNVHEGPQNIRLNENPTPLRPGMITSNEPGVYLTGKYGIRCENLVLTTVAEETEFGTFYKFETLTLCPFDRNLFDLSIMTEPEIEWVNNYHKMVYDRLSPLLNTEECEWLAAATAPLQ